MTFLDSDIPPRKPTVSQEKLREKVKQPCGKYCFVHLPLSDDEDEDEDDGDKNVCQPLLCHCANKYVLTMMYVGDHRSVDRGRCRNTQSALDTFPGYVTLLACLGMSEAV